MGYLNNTKKIWLVLNNSVAEARIKLKLESKGYEIGPATQDRTRPVQSESQMVKEIEDFKPHLVLLNVDQTDFSGCDLCRQIKANPQLTGIRLILFGTKPDRANILKAYQMGASYYVAVAAEDYSLLLGLVDKLLASTYLV